MAKEIVSLSLDSKIIELIDSQVKWQNKKSRSQFVEEQFAKAFGLKELIPQPSEFELEKMAKIREG